MFANSSYTLRVYIQVYLRFIFGSVKSMFGVMSAPLPLPLRNFLFALLTIPRVSVPLSSYFYISSENFCPTDILVVVQVGMKYFVYNK